MYMYLITSFSLPCLDTLSFFLSFFLSFLISFFLSFFFLSVCLSFPLYPLFRVGSFYLYASSFSIKCNTCWLVYNIVLVNVVFSVMYLYLITTFVTVFSQYTFYLSFFLFISVFLSLYLSFFLSVALFFPVGSFYSYASSFSIKCNTYW